MHEGVHLCEVSRVGGNGPPALGKGDPFRGETECGACRNIRVKR